MKHFVLLFFIVVFIDSLYLYTIKTPFSNMITNIQKSNIKLNVYSIFVCYLLVCICIYYFLWKKTASYKEAFLLGMIIYGIFDTTNIALFHDWDITLSIIDTIWGGIFFSSSLYVMNHLSFYIK